MLIIPRCVLWVELQTNFLLSKSNLKDMGFALNFFQDGEELTLPE